MTRPSLFPHRIIFNTDDEQHDALAEYAHKKKMTRAEAIRTLLRAALNLNLRFVGGRRGGWSADAVGGGVAVGRAVEVETWGDAGDSVYVGSGGGKGQQK